MKMMKLKWITFFISLIAGIVFVFFLKPTQALEHFNVFASTNQIQASKPHPTDIQSPKSNNESDVFQNKQPQEQFMPTEDKNTTETSNVLNKKAYLTFDDGPSPTTEILLSILEEYQVKATFFMLEPRMNLFPDAVIQIAENGHRLGLHGVTHNRNIYRSEETVIDEMNLAQETLTSLTGIKAVLIRTPYGSKPDMTDSYKEAVAEAGFILWDWNVDSKDWFFKDARLINHTISQLQVLEESKADPVILLHDNKYTIEYLPQLLSYLIQNDYELFKLDATMEPVLLR